MVNEIVDNIFTTYSLLALVNINHLTNSKIKICLTFPVQNNGESKIVIVFYWRSFYIVEFLTAHIWCLLEATFYSDYLYRTPPSIWDYVIIVPLTTTTTKSIFLLEKSCARMWVLHAAMVFVFFLRHVVMDSMIVWTTQMSYIVVWYFLGRRQWSSKQKHTNWGGTPEL